MSEQGPTPELNKERERFIFGVASEPSARHPSRNEDAYLVSPEHGLFAVFDGMGGHAGGEVAAQVGRDTLRERLTLLSGKEDQVKAKEWLSETLVAINQKIVDQARIQFELYGMGTAGSVFVATKQAGRLVGLAGSAADTRVWLFRDNQLRQITIDNIDASTQEPDAQSNREMLQRLNQVKDVGDLQNLVVLDRFMFSRRNFVNNYLGGDEHSTRIELFELLPNDRVLLSTDGIHDNLTSDEIASSLAEIGDSTAAAKHLVWQSQQTSRSKSIRAKPDDMTALVVEITGQ